MNNIEKVILPSNGLLGVEREVTIRGMKGIEISTLFSSLTDAAIDNIIKSVTDPSLDPENLCDEDKKFILHKTRVLTFGNNIEQTLRCPYCRNIHTYELNYKDFEVTLLEEDYITKVIEIGNDKIIPRIPNSKVFNEINRYKDKANLSSDYTFILLQVARIDTVNGKKIPIVKMIEYLENLPGVELVKLSKELDVKFGLNTTFIVECNNCNTAFTGGIGINADLFR